MNAANAENGDDHRFMARALRLAERGLYSTDPNPRVGCVIVRDGHIIAEGWHRRAGGPHAEVEALQAAGEAARGATVYVTLEPCCHHGKTPPCTASLINAGVSRVVAAQRDPNPRVLGGGLAQLAAAGIATTVGVLADAAELLNLGFFQRMRHGRPWLRSKLAMSLDGRTAMASGESRWITSPESRRDVHRLRARSSAILTGIGTALADDPELTARLDEEIELVQPMRVVLDTKLRLPKTAKLAHSPGRTVVLTAAGPTHAAVQSIGETVEVQELPTAPDGRLNLQSVVAWLGQAECNEVLVEAGAELNGALLNADLIDEWIIYVAPVILGDGGRGLFHLPRLEKMADRHELRLVETRQIGPDLKLRLTRRV